MYKQIIFENSNSLNFGNFKNGYTLTTSLWDWYLNYTKLNLFISMRVNTVIRNSLHRLDTTQHARTLLSPHYQHSITMQTAQNMSCFFRVCIYSNVIFCIQFQLNYQSQKQSYCTGSLNIKWSFLNINLLQDNWVNNVLNNFFFKQSRSAV